MKEYLKYVKTVLDILDKY
ncbi:1d8f8e14-c7da-4c26-aae5-2bf714eb2450 [Thermothielavioides terrestris]|uniref:1d8f8e14-c7da-4c26-aae5-2bf714eb2450 n=1 Tax=Thermothielavioides terrestris TaxID=2587410 RepID=A0A3S4BNX3_9PEZI|nr:1d8f8e14-c7da-4c26-aae5-2bf714eb2450 [Thermothielavioides terrestris]